MPAMFITTEPVRADDDRVITYATTGLGRRLATVTLTAAGPHPVVTVYTDEEPFTMRGATDLAEATALAAALLKMRGWAPVPAPIA